LFVVYVELSPDEDNAAGLDIMEIVASLNVRLGIFPTTNMENVHQFIMRKITLKVRLQQLKHVQIN
jgi:hypothetical protein